MGRCAVPRLVFVPWVLSCPRDTVAAMRASAESRLRAVTRPGEAPGPPNGRPGLSEPENAPVEILLERDHPFKKRRRDPHTGKKRIGCEVCRKGKLAPVHMGAPPSLNDGGSGLDRMAYQALKKAWQGALMEQLERSGLPQGLEAVDVEALIGFPTLARRDGGNYRWMVEKALGDALVQGGHLPDDSFFPVSRYEFSGVQGVHSPGRSWLRLLVLPRAAREQTGDQFVMPAVPQTDQLQIPA